MVCFPLFVLKCGCFLDPCLTYSTTTCGFQKKIKFFFWILLPEHERYKTKTQKMMLTNCTVLLFMQTILRDFILSCDMLEAYQKHCFRIMVAFMNIRNLPSKKPWAIIAG